MKRRAFLKATLVSAGTLVVGCGDDTAAPLAGDSGQPDLTDDGVGPDIDASDAGDATADQLTDADLGRVLEPGDAFFPQSVASGDPRADSVILWTRLEAGDGDAELELELALDERFRRLVSLDGEASITVAAEAAFDHCVKVKLSGLDAGTTYFYRFIHRENDTEYGSRTGRTRTAPAADDDSPVRFAFVSCQDYSGRYYNSYRMLAKLDDIDFVIHLGDYIYETTDDPVFQSGSPDRFIEFTDQAGAIIFNEGTETEFFAARSVDNYRELYKIYRSDVDLRRVHERFPMIVTWDDHEFSDDCHGASSTYFDGEREELDVERRKNANQAWFEYMPVDYVAGDDFVYDREEDFPNDLVIYRDIEYGANLHVVMTDVRSRRSDHLIPEDALPGGIAMTEADLTAALGAVPEFALPYVDIDTFDGGSYKAALVAAAADIGINEDRVAGPVAVPWINGVAEELNTAGADPAIALIEDTESLERGLAFLQMGKTSGFADLGARYFVVKDTFDLYAGWRYAQTGGASEQAFGDEQQAWFLDTMRASDRTWKIWGNSFTLTPRVIDLTELGIVPEQFQQKFRVFAEDWDGMPNRRNELIEALAEVGNVVAVTGDVHAFFASSTPSDNDPDSKIPEFVTGAISSATYQRLLAEKAGRDPDLAAAGAAELALLIKTFLQDPVLTPNPHLAHANVTNHGFAVVDVASDALEVTMYGIDQNKTEEHLGDAPEDLDDAFEQSRFRVELDSTELYGEINGEWKAWDPEEADWES